MSTHKGSLNAYHTLPDACSHDFPAFPLCTHRVLLESVLNAHFILLCIILNTCLPHQNHIFIALCQNTTKSHWIKT